MKPVSVKFDDPTNDGTRAAGDGLAQGRDTAESGRNQKVGSPMGWLKQLLEMAQTLLRLTDDLKRIQEREASEREKLLLKVENQLLKANRQLPPSELE